jgi:hypothetical protein
MRRNQIYLIFVLLIFITGFAIFHYVFSIYEVFYKVTPDRLYADNSSVLTIESKPINSFGWRAPFRNSPTKFIFTEGEELVDIISIDEENGILQIRAKCKAGKVSVLLKSKHSLLPSTIEIIIEPNVV